MGAGGAPRLGNRLTSKLRTTTDPIPSNRRSSIALAAGGTRGFTYDGEARPDGLPVEGRQRAMRPGTLARAVDPQTRMITFGGN